MQLVHITLTALQRRNRVAFAVTPLGSPSPETGEHVVVQDQSGAFFGAVCVDSAYDADGRGTHRLRLGAALPEILVERRLGRHDVPSPAAEALHAQVEQYLTEAAAFQASFAE
ncbi:hypothetical protein [Nocardioides marmoribigeumensis]|jgi:hypothetical protein|uniref:Uncharacterized protein n=1 Tax=Nocardioides marmoribigeumensis TaxID=433649 RepID=A0ABU2BWJ3_9ACTN|nr:hypothetical protein [Nocardioides marmoribigeumensis]MDR7362771.1 hypothetical protein [Nocardioides marmoribigeumensis]